jgi:DNA-3-methyladenine glycosylase
LAHAAYPRQQGGRASLASVRLAAVPDPDQRTLLAREFFDRPATEVAPDLLGCVLWHASPAGIVAARLVEVEAYRGGIDPASHAFRGRTSRNAVMFGPPGHAYVYFSYGMHYCVNLVCAAPGHGEAVLIRAGAVVEGADLARRRRYGPPETNGDIADTGGRSLRRELDLARGPGRLCQALGIDRSQDGADICSRGGPLGIGPAPAGRPEADGVAVIRAGPRVGISKAAELPWRYWVAGDGHVSSYRPSQPRPTRPKPVSGSDTEDGTMHG